MRRCLAQAVKGLVLLWGLGAAAMAQADNSAADIKTAFIYNFAKFVEWPRSAFQDDHSPLHLCLWGQPMEGRLNLLNGREAQGRPIRVRSVDSVDSIPGCHILVVGDTSDSIRTQLLQVPARSSVLTISDSRDFTQQGGMIGLFVAASRVQFSVNLGAAQSAGLKMSARMLQLAHGVRGGTP
jgi:hypothetical protein